MTASTADIQFLWWSGCPSWEKVLEMLREQMAAQGLGAESLEVIEVRGEAAAEELGFPGSPTILVRGQDIQPPGNGQVGGLTCRVYRQRDGGTSPLPDPEDLRDALVRIEE